MIVKHQLALFPISRNETNKMKRKFFRPLLSVEVAEQTERKTQAAHNSRWNTESQALIGSQERLKTTGKGKKVAVSTLKWPWIFGDVNVNI